MYSSGKTIKRRENSGKIVGEIRVRREGRRNEILLPDVRKVRKEMEPSLTMTKSTLVLP